MHNMILVYTIVQTYNSEILTATLETTQPSFKFYTMCMLIHF